jgi:tetratricopeptide (TPR) repeat protein
MTIQIQHRLVARLLLLFCGACLIPASSPGARAADFAAPGASDTKPRGKPNSSAWSKNRDAGRKALAEGKVDEAGAFFEAALAEAEKFDSKDVRLAESLSDLANFRMRTQDYASAETLFGRALAIRRGDPDRLLEAQCLFSVAEAAQHLQKYDEAEKDLLEAQDIVDRKVGPDHPLDAICRYGLGKIHQEKEDYAKAEPLFKQALELFLHPPSKVKFEQRRDPAVYGPTAMRYTYEPNYVLALDTLGRLSSIYLKQNQPDKAETCCLDTIKVLKESNAHEAQVQHAEQNLAAFYISQTNYPKAQAVLERLEHAQEKSPGLKSPATLKTIAQLAFVYDHEDRLADAESTFKKVVDLMEQNGSPGSEEALSVSGALAAFYERHERFEQAAAVYERLWKRTQEARPDDLRDLPALSRLLAIYQKLGRDEGMEKVYQQQIATFGKTFGSNNKALVKPLDDYAKLLRKQKRDPEAETAEARAKAIRGESAP